MGLLALALVLLVLNNLVYNWVFLPKYYSEHPKTFFITSHQVREYLRWVPGGLVTSLNVLLFVISAILFRFGKPDKGARTE
mgnify:CR=1 FL=1